MYYVHSFPDKKIPRSTKMYILAFNIVRQNNEYIFKAKYVLCGGILCFKCVKIYFAVPNLMNI